MIKTPTKIKNKNLDMYELKKKDKLLNIIKIENEKIKSYYDKLSIKHKFRKDQSQKIFDARNTFMSNFNENINKEFELFCEISNNFDPNNMNNYVNMFKIFLESHPVKNSSCLVDIHKIISIKKDIILTNQIDKKEIKNKDQANDILNDIKNNKWNISDKNIKALMNMIN